METNLLTNIAYGFGVALTPVNFLYCAIGAVLGTVIGVLPGLGPVTTIVMLLPITFKIPAVASLIMLTGIYYGAHHSGSTAAIMLNMPGEPSSIVICQDGYPMAQQGRAGSALAIAAIGSFFAGCVGIVVIALLSPLVVRLSLLFGPPEYAAIMVMALVTASSLATTSLMTTVAMAVFGVVLGTIGTDVTTGVERFTFNIDNIANGLNFVAVAVGLFAFPDIILHLSRGHKGKLVFNRIERLLPSRGDLRASLPPILRGTALGAAFGILPGTGPLISSFASYALEKQWASDPSRFGKGAIEGVAGPEAANNAAAMTHFIPMLTLGIPAGAANALLLSAILIHGVTPGPSLMTDHPDLFWGVIASMWLGNMMLIVLNLPMIGLWVRALTIPYRLLYPAILVFCCIGVYSVDNQAADVVVTAIFTVLGLIFRKLGCEPGPLILGLVLGPALEETFRRSLLLSNGDPMVFLTHPISLGMLIFAAVMAVALTWRKKMPVVA
jgi:putative tricarboxylic transport membrane protein